MCLQCPNCPYVEWLSAATGYCNRSVYFIYYQKCYVTLMLSLFFYQWYIQQIKHCHQRDEMLLLVMNLYTDTDLFKANGLPWWEYLQTQVNWSRKQPFCSVTQRIFFFKIEVAVITQFERWSPGYTFTSQKESLLSATVSISWHAPCTVHDDIYCWMAPATMCGVRSPIESGLPNFRTALRTQALAIGFANYFSQSTQKRI